MFTVMPLMASKDSKETPQQMNENNVSRWPPSGAKNQTRAGLRPARRDKQADYRRKSGTPVHIIPVLLGSNTLLHEAKIISHTHTRSGNIENTTSYKNTLRYRAALSNDVLWLRRVVCLLFVLCVSNLRHQHCDEICSRSTSSGGRWRICPSGQHDAP